MNEETFKIVPLEMLVSARFQSHFPLDENDERFKELVASIKEIGIKQPLLARPQEDGKYEIVAGERRFRAAIAAGLKQAPILIEKMDDLQAVIVQGVENIQRQDLTEAEKSRYLGFVAVEFHLTPKQIAEKVGMSYPWVCHYLPAEFKNAEKAKAGQKGGEALAEEYRESEDVALRRRAESEESRQELAKAEQAALEHRSQCSNPACLKMVPDHELKYLPNGKPYCSSCYPLALTHYNNEEKRLKAKKSDKSASPKSLDGWPQKQANMSPGKSAFEERVINRFRQWLSDQGLGLETDKKFCVLSTTPDAYVPELEGLVYIDGAAVHSGNREDKDERLRDLLKKHNQDLNIQGFKYKADSKTEEDRVFEALCQWALDLKEAKEPLYAENIEMKEEKTGE